MLPMLRATRSFHGSVAGEEDDDDDHHHDLDHDNVLFFWLMQVKVKVIMKVRVREQMDKVLHTVFRLMKVKVKEKVKMVVRVKVNMNVRVKVIVKVKVIMCCILWPPMLHILAACK